MPCQLQGQTHPPPGIKTMPAPPRKLTAGARPFRINLTSIRLNGSAPPRQGCTPVSIASQFTMRITCQDQFRVRTVHRIARRNLDRVICLPAARTAGLAIQLLTRLEAAARGRAFRQPHPGVMLASQTRAGRKAPCAAFAGVARHKRPEPGQARKRGHMLVQRLVVGDIQNNGGDMRTSDFKVTERSAPVALTMAVCHDQNPMTR